MQRPIWMILVANERSHWVLSYRIVSNDLGSLLFATEAQNCQQMQSYILAAINDILLLYKNEFNIYNIKSEFPN